MSTELALPKNGNVNEWTEQEKAIVEASGLVDRGQLAPRATVEAFLAHCQRTGLDPIARQIYAICRKGRWGIQVSIDGARLIAERSGKYAGQTPVEWTADGQTWTQVWLDKNAPAAARVGVHRSDFKEPLFAVANFAAYNAGGPMWQKMPALMVGKCAEMLALRKAFPQDLSGLYSTEEMDQAGQPQQAAQHQPEPAAAVPAEPSADDDGVIDAEVIEGEDGDTTGEPDMTQAWIDAIKGAADRGQLMAVWEDAKSKGAHTDQRIRAVFAERGQVFKQEAA
ncbi:MAG: phage recombination protein Bet [Brachybacterium sp.]|uniref:phage recombination protein Bet n=1 Tax=Brachybacterium sp. TaxID=1891286 RepID=UPI002649ED08|nr:phage recombination protein Bet [Brachybacterium sp.]MDN5687083.1 phage recombination protein Bet [Brachybacterium sp.]